MNTVPDSDILLYEETDSTNLRLKQSILQGSPVRAVLAQRQTAGRGRLGRSFLSPEGGLYMSRACPLPENGFPVTLRAAVAVRRAVLERCGMPLAIKWVNDLFYRGKKVCGILAEAIGNSAVIGIGLNLITPPGGFPGVPEAGALETDVPPQVLFADILCAMDRVLTEPDRVILAEYAQNMPLIGHTITRTENGITKTALVKGLDEQGGLIIAYPDGTVQVLRTGEVSLGSAQMSSCFGLP